MASSPNARNVEWDVEYSCIRVNGLLYPTPINQVALYPTPINQVAPPTFPHEEPPQSRTRTEGSRRKRRSLMAAKVLSIKELYLELLTCNEESAFILKTHEIDTGDDTFYLLSPYLDNGKRKMRATETLLGQRVVVPVTEEVYSDIENKYGLSLKERLEGKWTLETRERTTTTKTDKVYVHDKIMKNMRSLTAVATFIMYAMIYN